MPTIKFTKTAIDLIEPSDERVDYFDSDVKGLSLRVTRGGIKTFSLMYRVNRIKKRYTIGKYPSIPIAVAKKEAQRLLLLVSQGEDIQQVKKVKKEDTNLFTLKKYLDEFYANWSKQNHRSSSKIMRMLLVTCRPLHDIALDQIDLTVFNKFLFKYRSNSSVSDATVNRVAVALKGAISRAVEFGYLKENKLVGFKKLQESFGKVRYLSTQESLALLDAINHVDQLTRNIVSVAYYSGMRRGEIFSLAWEDVDFKTNQITLNKSKTKSGKTRNIPMHTKIRELFLELYSGSSYDDLVFKSPKTGLMLDNIDKSWKTLMKKAAIENFRFHDLRHNFASQLVMKGESLSVVRELLGHSDFKMTLRYAHLAPEHKQRAVDLL